MYGGGTPDFDEMGSTAPVMPAAPQSLGPVIPEVTPTVGPPGTTITPPAPPEFDRFGGGRTMSGMGFADDRVPTTTPLGNALPPTQYVSPQEQFLMDYPDWATTPPTLPPAPQDQIDITPSDKGGGMILGGPKSKGFDPTTAYADVPYDLGWWARVNLSPDLTPQQMHEVYMKHGHPQYSQNRGIMGMSGIPDALGGGALPPMPNPILPSMPVAPTPPVDVVQESIESEVIPPELPVAPIQQQATPNTLGVPERENIERELMWREPGFTGADLMRQNVGVGAPIMPSVNMNEINKRLKKLSELRNTPMQHYSPGGY